MPSAEKQGGEVREPAAKKQKTIAKAKPLAMDFDISSISALKPSTLSSRGSLLKPTTATTLPQNNVQQVKTLSLNDYKRRKGLT